MTNNKNLLIILAALMAFAAPLFAQEDPAPQPVPMPVEEVIDPEREITLDFVQKDIHVVMHYIGLRSGLNITVEGSITIKLTVIYRNVKPKQAIKHICESNELLYVENGPFIYIKTKPGGRSPQANVVEAAGKPGRFNVSFETHELVAAIMETARATGVNAFVPATLSEGPRATSTEEMERQARVIESMRQRRISMFMREATPDDIFNRLAQLGDMNLAPDKAQGYRFIYKPVDVGSGTGPGPGPGPGGDDLKFETRDWVLPGRRVATYEPQLRNLMSVRGKIVYDDNTSFILVTDTADRMSVISAFMDRVQQLSEEAAAKALLNPDPMVVKSYTTKRDVTDTVFQQQLREILSQEGRVVVNADRNTIVVFEHQSRMSNVDTFITNVDTVPEQVQISGQLVEVTLDKYMGWGLQWFTEHGAQNLNDGRFTGSAFDSATESVGGMFGQPTGFGPYFATFVNPRINLRLEMLANEGKARTLIRPSALISNKKTGRITVGQEVPYLEATSAGGGTATASVSFKEIAIVMEVTPTILGDGLMRLDIKLTIKEQIAQIAIQGNNTPVLSNREAVSNVFIRHGETLAIGGMIRERTRTEETGIPVLKDIPLLGFLFKSANIREEKTDVLFFLTPHIHTAHGQVTDDPEGRSLKLERELRPTVADDLEPRKENWLPSQYAVPGPAPKPPHWDRRKTITNPKDVNPNE